MVRKFDPKKRLIGVAEFEGKVVRRLYLSWCYGGRPAYDKTAEIGMYFDHNETTQRLNEKSGFEVAGNLPELAELWGQSVD